MTPVEPRTRIALVAHRLAAPAPTGIGRYYRELIRHLAAVADPAIHEVVAASPREGDAAGWLPDGVVRRMVPGPRKLVTLLWCLTRRPLADAALGHPDVAHVLHPWAPVPLRAPIAVTIHDLMPSLHPEWYPRSETWTFERGVRHARDHAAAVITDSRFVADQLHDQLGIERERLHVVHCGIGDEFRARPDAATVDAVARRHGAAPGRYLLAVGQVGDRKNQHVLVDAMARAADLPDDVVLLIAGPPAVGAEGVRRHIDRLGVASRVRLTGFLPAEDLVPLVAGARSLVHPSRDEGFGFTPLEAMAAGVPALAAASGSLPEVCGDAAVLLDPDDPDAWAEAMVRVAVDEDHRAALVARGDRWSARFTWPTTARDTLAVLSDLVP